MRTQIIRVAAVILIALARGVLPSSAAAAPLDAVEARALMSNEHRHVRAVDKRVSNAIEDGLRRSDTFAHLVLALDRSDVIVYVETAPGLPSSLSGRMLIVAGSTGQRYLRIQIAAGPRGNELIALVGHELQHALEVAQAPEVRDERSLIALYQAIGHAGQGPHRYDTMAAQHAGRQVRTELIG